MARITEKIKIYIHQDTNNGHYEYYMSDITEHFGSWLTLVGTTEALISFEETDLIDHRTAQLNRAEQDLESHRAESALKERQLLDKLESLRALPHLEASRD